MKCTTQNLVEWLLCNRYNARVPLHLTQNEVVCPLGHVVVVKIRLTKKEHAQTVAHAPTCPALQLYPKVYDRQIDSDGASRERKFRKDSNLPIENLCWFEWLAAGRMDIFGSAKIKVINQNEILVKSKFE